jgi:TPR repeat protein
MRTYPSSFLRRALGLLMLVSVPCSPAWASYDDGVAAYQHGRFDLAIKAFGDAAARGDARAKRSLGLMHERGEGVPRDVAMAAEWYRKALALGLESAQYNLAFVTPPSAARAPTVQIATSRP